MGRGTRLGQAPQGGGNGKQNPPVIIQRRNASGENAVWLPWSQPALPCPPILREPVPGLSNTNPVLSRADKALHSLRPLAHFWGKVWGQTSFFHSTP